MRLPSNIVRLQLADVPAVTSSRNAPNASQEAYNAATHLWRPKMSNLYGIEDADDCREKFNELIEMCTEAEQAKNKKTVTELKNCLTDYHKAGDTKRGLEQMSEIEKRYFWPAIYESYAIIKLNAPKTWADSLYRIKGNLQFYRLKLP
jgi:hypothetical protein